MVAVVIPNYKETLNTNEEISLTQVKKILGKYDIFFILPDTLKIDYGSSEIFEKRYPDEYFLSVRMYSKFMLMPNLYQDFIDYKYILLYQLDAFVFEDQLEEFCNLGYDYIGAPWINGVFFRKNEKENMWYVGNGGLSLRKVDPFLKWTKEKKFNQYIDYINEDLLIAVYGKPSLNIAPIDIAITFSFEMEFEECMKLTKGKIPFGCHGWEKYQFYSWKALIERQGYEVEIPDKKVIENIDLTKEMNEFCNKEFADGELERQLPSLYTGEVYIWGTGLWGISLMYKLEKSGIKIAGFIDNNRVRCGNKILSYEIIHPTELGYNKEVIIVAIKKKSIEVEEQLQKNGYKMGTDYTTIQKMIESI